MAKLTLKCMEIADYIIHKINIYNENRPFRENVLFNIFSHWPKNGRSGYIHST